MTNNYSVKIAQDFYGFPASSTAFMKTGQLLVYIKNFKGSKKDFSYSSVSVFIHKFE
jgi:hypothetical protein